MPCSQRRCAASERARRLLLGPPSVQAAVCWAVTRLGAAGCARLPIRRSRQEPCETTPSNPGCARPTCEVPSGRGRERFEWRACADFLQDPAASRTRRRGSREKSEIAAKNRTCDARDAPRDRPAPSVPICDLGFCRSSGRRWRVPAPDDREIRVTTSIFCSYLAESRGWPSSAILVASPPVDGCAPRRGTRIRLLRPARSRSTPAAVHRRRRAPTPSARRSDRP